MTHKERMLAAMDHQTVDRLPTDIWAVDEILDKLAEHFGVHSFLEICDRLEIDGIFNITPSYIGPPARLVEDLYFNEWGMGYRMQEYQGGLYEEQMVYPLAQAQTIADLEAFPWPSPDWYDYSRLPGLAQLYPDRAIICGYTAVFYWHNKLRGLEQSLLDPLERPMFTLYLLQKISDFFATYHQRCFEAAPGLIDTTQVTDDFGSQTSLLISPRVFDTFYRQPIQRGIDLARAYHIRVFHHDDGDCRRLLPRLAGMGINLLNPIQWRCGNWDLNTLKDEFGSRICFHGGVDNQQTLPFGTPDEVRAEVCWLKQTLGKDGTGYIIAPCHNIQTITPLENIFALYEAAAS
jgi:uroporphyrinogen decarboxylase